jgi:hypothetical protein
MVILIVITSLIITSIVVMIMVIQSAPSQQTKVSSNGQVIS